MHTPLRSVVLVTICLQLAQAVKLSDFSPQVTGLSASCDKVYRTDITGCQTSDFNNGGACGQTCVSGLVSINTQLKTACANDKVSSSSLVGLFLSGSGIQTLCPNVKVETKAGSTTPALATSAPATTATIGASTMQLSSSAVSSSLIIDTSSPPPAASSLSPVFPSTSTSSTTLQTSTSVTASSVTSAPSSSTSSGLIVDSSATPTQTLQPPNASLFSQLSSTTSEAAATATVKSGGGSPFDVTSTSAAEPRRISDSMRRMTIALAAVLTALILR